jgi:AraC family transcriptional regulator
MRFQVDEKYQQALIATLVYIQTHLEDELTLERLAGRAGFSPFHFHRVFSEFVGEPVKEYIRRLRLERGAYRLKISQDPIVRIALDSGFKTHETFTRAFAASLASTQASFATTSSGAQPGTSSRGPAKQWLHRRFWARRACYPTARPTRARA